MNDRDASNLILRIVHVGAWEGRSLRTWANNNGAGLSVPRFYHLAGQLVRLGRLIETTHTRDVLGCQIMYKRYARATSALCAVALHQVRDWGYWG